MQCPFKHIIQQKPKAEEDDSKPAASPTSCPFPLHAASTSPPSPPQKQGSDGVCPLGFSSGKHGSALGPLSCSLCRSILHEATRLMPCQHGFCCHCVSKFSDCPVCGRDIESRDFDESLDKEALKSIEEAIAKVDSTSLKASVYLKLGTQSLAFGNHQAAFQRLEECSRLLRGMMRPDSSTECQLGAVLGMQGDCKIRSGQPFEALSFYREAVSMLNPHSSIDREAARLLAISLNKAGDLHYNFGDHLLASGSYASALEIRRSAIEQLGSDGESLASVSLILDLVASLIKLGDVILAAREEGKETTTLPDPQSLLLEAEQRLSPVEAILSSSINMEGQGALVERMRRLRSTLNTLKIPIQD